MNTLASAPSDGILHVTKTRIETAASRNKTCEEQKCRCANDDLPTHYFFSSFGTKVIPHFGHLPGLDCWTSGCIEQV